MDAVTGSVAGRPRGAPYDSPERGYFYEPRGTRGNVVSLSLSPRSSIRRSRPTGRPEDCDRRSAKLQAASLSYQELLISSFYDGR